MDGNNRFGKNTVIGGALLLVSIALAAAGIAISLRSGDTKVFTLFSIPAAVLIVTGGSMIGRDLLPGANRLLLAGGEKTITAAVLGVTRNLRTVGEKTAYYIVCRYKDPVTGKEETYSSRPLAEYPGKEVIGRKVTVRLDTGEQGRYTVEIDALLEEIRKEKEALNTGKPEAQAIEKSEAQAAGKPEAKRKEKKMTSLDSFVKRAKEDKPVYITEVRKAFQAEGSRDFHIHVHLYDGKTAVFPLMLPDCRNEEERAFTASYIRAFVHNLFSTLGALRMEIYLDTSDKELLSAAENLYSEFQMGLSTAERFGFGKSLNVNDRIIRALFGNQKSFSFEVLDISGEPAVSQSTEEESAASFTDLPAMAESLFLLGIDVGGTDVKFAVSRNGKLVQCEELNWAPASFANVEQLTDPIMEAAERLMEQFGQGSKWDAIGVSWPDAIIRNMIVGGETTKTKGLRENKERDYEEQLAYLSGLCGRLGAFTKGGSSVMCCNDGPMAAFTDAVEMAAAGEDVSRGFFAYSLGTELGTGWVEPSGEIPQIPLEVYNCIIDLGSYKSLDYGAEDIRSIRNVNTLIPGTLQKYTGQSGVFRLAYKNLPDKEPEILREAMDRGLFEARQDDSSPDGLFVTVPTEPEDMRKECLEFFMEKAADGESEVCRGIFRTIGAYIAVTWAENEYMLHPAATERTLFGRLVKRPECFELIKEGAEKIEPSLVLKCADSDLAVTPLMRQLEEDPVFTVAQFAQAVGALYFGCLALR